MQKKRIIALSGALAAMALVLVGLGLLSLNEVEPNLGPYWKRAFPIVDVYQPNLIYGYENRSRGSSFTLSFELVNRLESQSEVAYTFGTNGWDPMSPTSVMKYFEANFSTPSPIVLQPLENKTLTLTISIADDTPIGKYLFGATFNSLDFDGGNFFQGYDVGFTVIP